jgi:hypothetical protein
MYVRVTDLELANDIAGVRSEDAKEDNEDETRNYS